MAHMMRAQITLHDCSSTYCTSIPKYEMQVNAGVDESTRVLTLTYRQLVNILTHTHLPVR